MLRLVVIHQLVLALLVGPMLCCCTALKLGHDANQHSALGSSSEPTPCCSHDQKSDQGDHPDGRNQGEPAKCPCKDAPQQITAVSETTTSPVDGSYVFASSVFFVAAPVLTEVPTGLTRSLSASALPSSSISTADLLFAHHNLRC